MCQVNLIPASDFDVWAETYDQSVQTNPHFPFTGYESVLATILKLANPSAGQTILDLGTGTGNLALLFAAQGCQLTCTDFSKPMLAQARRKIPQAEFFLHDLGLPLPWVDRRFDVIVSAYVFHHFQIEQKIEICRKLLYNNLAEDGKLIIGDISFASLADQEVFRQTTSDWDEEFYWLADESALMFDRAGLEVRYTQLSACAGVYQIKHKLQ
ncbi:MAG: hypothetical protein CVU44_14215 [Chloroflexi bacterium HGW-Chloroflexi-6]|nr:MAG: hypothetical protein CVU44_14215 [Chloroflexi bacterium HGW-Chloroflexi-6]